MNARLSGRIGATTNRERRALAGVPVLVTISVTKLVFPRREVR
jgi:hypothetical protein